MKSYNYHSSYKNYWVNIINIVNSYGKKSLYGIMKDILILIITNYHY